MLKTFNCGVGFCLIVKRSNLNKIIRYFPKKFKPYIIGKIVKNSKKVKLSGKISGKKNTAVFISGRGSNLRSLIKYSKKKNSLIKIILVISNNFSAKGLKYANKSKINNLWYKFKNKSNFENNLLKLLKKII